MASPVKPKLLVMELWGVGDLVIATPFLRAAAGRFDVSILAKPYACDLQAHFWPGIRVIPYVAPWTAFRHKYRFWAWTWPPLIRMLRRLAAERFDVGVSGRWDPRDHVLLALAGVRRRIGFSRAGSKVWLHDPLPRPAPGSHRYEHWRALADVLELPVPVRGKIEMPPARRGYILIHSGAARGVRVWPLERFAGLAARLRQRGLRVQVACDADQKKWWLGAGESAVAVPARVAELLRVTRGAALFIGNDSGPGHLAAFDGVPTFTLFGAQLPEWFAPLHPASEWIEGPVCPYRPCSDYCKFPQPFCLRDLTEEAVWMQVAPFVAKHADRLESTSSVGAAPG